MDHPVRDFSEEALVSRIGEMSQGERVFMARYARQGVSHLPRMRNAAVRVHALANPVNLCRGPLATWAL